ncbi:MAG TPA: sigma-70 family RNA polymerase sigma factor [Tepidisphaeraceae bacterium]|nr:sigma-70 family RNA polymerase sigma factor [Tepidisphaeraceae bacterium]
MFEEIVRRYAGMVFSVCLRTCKDAHDAEDATQAVFLALAVQCKSGNPVRHLPAWLRQVAKRTSLDVRKSRKRREAREARRSAENNGIINDDDKPSAMDLSEIGHVLSEELAKLPAKYRLPLVSLYFGGLSREEIAEQLGLKPGALGVRLHRARTMLGERLKRRGAITDGAVLSAGMAPLLETAFGQALTQRTVDAAAQVMLGHSLSGAVSANVLALMNGTYTVVSLGKLKIVASVVMLLATVAGGSMAAVRAPESIPSLVTHVRQWIEGLRFEFHLPRFELQASANDPVPQPALPQDRYATAPEGMSPEAMIGDVAHAPQPTTFVPAPQPAQSPAPAPRTTPSLLPPPGPRGNPFPTVIASTSTSTSSSMNLPDPIVREDDRDEVDAQQRAAANEPSRRPPAAPTAGSPVDGQDAIASIAPTYVGTSSGAVGVSHAPSQGSAFIASAARRPMRGRIAGPTVSVGAAAGTSGTLSIDGGTLVAGLEDIGREGQGTLAQNGGLNITTQLLLGEGAGGSGTYLLRRGELRFARNGSSASVGMVVGGRGRGTLLLGDALGSGNITTEPLSGVPIGTLPLPLTDRPFVIVRGSDMGSGVVRGWGRIDAPGGTFVNNGQVIADGYGQDRELALADFAQVDNLIENPTIGGNNGWFAQNRGQLTLPAHASATSPNTFTWGESQTDVTLDLVNSVRLVIDPPPQIVTVSLLSTDRSDIPQLPGGHSFIGVWSLDTGDVVPDSVDVSVRYDDALATNRGLDESGLKLWRYADGDWSLVTGQTFWRDVDNNLIGGKTDGLTLFAISAPEPGAVTTLLGLGAAALLRRRRR